MHFLHGGALHGLLNRALGHELPEGLVPFAPESGRVRFAEGDLYHFGLTATPAAGPRLGALGPALVALGRTAPARSGPPVTLGGNFEVEAVEVAGEITADDLHRLAAEILAQEAVTLCWLSPLRMERPQDLRAPGAGYLNGDCFPAGIFLERLALRLGKLGLGAFPPAAELPAIPAAANAEPRHLTWIDLPLTGRAEARPGRDTRMTLGGVLGTVRLSGLSGLSGPWPQLLALGRFLHVGQSTPYGLGRFAIDEVSAAATDPFQPAQSFLAEAAAPAALSSALDHLMADRGDPLAEIDGAPPGEGALEALGEDLLAGRYRPPPLEGWLLPREEGGVRPLAVPPLRDRAAQRAAALALAPGIDTLLEDCSYAYRKGFSRAGAARAIQRAYDDGFRVVLDADIEAFFDSVDLDRLLGKLRALLPLEPLVEAVETWLRSPVRFHGHLLERRQGLPQGSPLSPLLANLYLDELDDEILGQGYRLVRFADDFVVLCKSVEEAERAREAARQALSELGLTLHEGKTAVRHLDQGLTYLGYLFCRSLVLDEESETDAEGGAGDAGRTLELTAESIPAASWLAQVPFERLRALVAAGAASGPRRGPLEAVPLAAPDHALAPAKRPLYLLRWDAEVRVSGGQLVVELPGEAPTELPLEGLSHLVFVGRSRATLPALLALARRGVPSYFTSTSGRLAATLSPPDPDWTLWQAQASLAARPEAVLAFAREIVSAKLGNAAVLASRLKLQGHGEAAGELRQLSREALNKTELDSLRGLEGRGAARFFAALGASLPEEWGFAGRKTQPPPDPVNAMLSFGYTLLHHHAATALLAAGLNPQIGLFHRPHGRHLALASDLQEELRHLVDSLVVALVRRREIQPGDFARPRMGGLGVLLTREARKRFVERFEERLSVLFTPEPGADRITYWQLLARQAGQVRRLARGELSLYRALRIER